MNITPQIAEKDANRMEHIMSDETFEALKNITKKGVNANDVFIDSVLYKRLR